MSGEGFHRSRRLLLAVAAALALSCAPAGASVSQDLRIDRVVVVKSERLMYLIKDGEVVRTFPVGLGPNPIGPKYFSGDGRTPEGSYVLDRRNPNSKFYRSIRVSYPNTDDYARSLSYGLSPGGAIMIHGEPTDPTQARRLLDRSDWTEGCIAVSNTDMTEIWERVDEGTPIDIVP